jgi:hypothetical protein
MTGVRKVALALVVGLGLIVAIGAAPAPATMPPVRCGKMKVEGKTYKVSGHLLDCDFVRKWSRKWLKSHDHPNGWTCADYSPEETRIAFSCRKGSKDYYAVRK